MTEQSEALFVALFAFLQDEVEEASGVLQSAKRSCIRNMPIFPIRTGRLAKVNDSCSSHRILLSLSSEVPRLVAAGLESGGAIAAVRESLE